jgi:uncharacterized protein YjiS (DUF1127 family)
MKTTRTHIDLDIATASAYGATGFRSIATDVLKRLVMLFRSFRNRREVMNLEDFTDQQLADIGLTRQDLDLSLASPWYDDPSIRLAERARRGRLVPFDHRI